jgi:hypothetical protein
MYIYELAKNLKLYYKNKNAIVSTSKNKNINFRSTLIANIINTYDINIDKIVEVEVYEKLTKTSKSNNRAVSPSLEGYTERLKNMPTFNRFIPTSDYPSIPNIKQNIFLHYYDTYKDFGDTHNKQTNYYTYIPGLNKYLKYKAKYLALKKQLNL